MILDEVAAYVAQRVAHAKKLVSPGELRGAALKLPKSDLRFARTLQADGVSLICEVKKAPPSKEIISEEFPYLVIAKECEAAEAGYISCLTEPKWLLGSDDIFRNIRNTVSIPMLRKGSAVDEYQLYEAKVLGADAVLLICALFDTKTIERYLGIRDTLGLSALAEAHDGTETESAAQAGAKIIGVNNHNLKNFTVGLSSAARLREKIPASILFVAESGVTGAADVARLKASGADAVLVGEALMKAPERRAALREFRRAVQ